MYKISEKDMNFISEVMEIWDAELTAGGKTLTVRENPEKHLPRRLVLATFISNNNDATQLNRKLIRDYKFAEFTRKQYMDDIKLSSKMKKKMDIWLKQ